MSTPPLFRPLPPGFATTSPPDAPLVSIVTCALDAERTIGHTLASVASQTFAGIEHIVVDGGSTDATCRLVREAPHRPRLVSDRDHGIYDAFNRGLALARGRWITFHNADDVYAHPRVVERVMERAARAPELGVFHADMDVVDDAGRVVREERFDPAAPLTFDLEMPVMHPTMFVARWVHTQVGGFDATYRIAGDYEFFLRVHLAGIEMSYIPEVLVRMGAGGISQRNPWMCELERMRAWRTCTGKLPWRLLLRELKLHGLDRWTPGLSRALGATKRGLIGGRVSTRRPPPAR